MSTKAKSIPITHYSEEWYAAWFFGKTYWFPKSIWTDFA